MCDRIQFRAFLGDMRDAVMWSPSLAGEEFYFKRRFMIEKLFQLQASGTTVKREIVAGCTTFMTLSYIIFVQPTVLSAAGMDSGAVMAATCITSAFAMVLMALLANYPIALAPGMGHNFYFTFTVCLTLGIAWQQALGAVFIAGVFFRSALLCRFARKGDGHSADSVEERHSRWDWVADCPCGFGVGRSYS